MKDSVKTIVCKSCGVRIEKMVLNNQVLYHERDGTILGFPNYKIHGCKVVE